MASTNTSHGRIELPPELRKLAPCFLLFIAVLAAYGNVYENAFVYDDESLITKNLFLRDWHALAQIFRMSITAGANIAGGFYRPLQIFVYFLIYQVAGLSEPAYHAANVLLHATNACLLFLLGRKLRFNPTAVFFAVLIWALHPFNVEAVTYISGTADPLETFFCLSALLILVPHFGSKQMVLAAPLFVLALLSKEEAVLFPLLAATSLFVTDNNRYRFKTYLCLWPLFAVLAAYLFVHFRLLNLGEFALRRQNDLYATSILCRIYTFLAALPSYLQFVVWPFHLHFDRDLQPVEHPWNLRVAAGFLLCLIAALQVALARSRRATALAFGFLWFAAADILHTGILIPVNASLLEHWLYLPTAGLFLGVAQSLASVKWQRKVRKPFETAAFSALAVFLGVLTYHQNTVWLDNETLYLNIFANGEPSPHAHNNLGIVYTLQHRFHDALEQYELSIELSGDTNPQTEHDLGITLLLGPDGDRYREEAIYHLKRAVAIDANYYPALQALAQLASQANDTESAETYRREADEAEKRALGR